MYIYIDLLPIYLVVSCIISPSVKLQRLKTFTRPPSWLRVTAASFTATSTLFRFYGFFLVPGLATPPF